MFVPGSNKEFLARAAFIATAVFSFKAGHRMFVGAGIWEPAVPVGLFLYTIAAMYLIAAFVVRRPDSRRSQAWIAVVLLGAVVSLVAFEIDFANRSYGTDAIAFAHESAEILLEGRNPYEVSGGSLDQVIARSNVPETAVTRSTTGDTVDRLVSYPAGHVLIYTAGMAVGIEDLRWVTLAFEVAGLALIWLALSSVGRLFVPFALLLDSDLPVHFTSGSVTDWLWVLPLIASAIFLHRQRLGYAGLALGIACAIKQQPWFVVPFAIVWAAKTLSHRNEEGRNDEGTGALLGGMGAGFLLPNIPFILWGTSHWLQGILHPALGNLVPDGQGFSILSSRGILPIPGYAYTFILGALGLASVWAYHRWFDRLQNLLWVIPPALLLFSHRSFHSYFIYWLPLALLWLDLRMNQSEPDTHNGSLIASKAQPNASLGTLALTMAVMTGVALAAFAIARPASLEVGSIEPQISGGLVTSMDVEVINRTERDVRPVFEVYWAGSPVPWEAREDTGIGPNQRMIIRIEPEAGDAVPPTRLRPNGEMEVAEFRVRVNDSGDAVYAASHLIRLKPLEVSVVNPSFALWKRDAMQRQAPLGWSITRFGGLESENAARPVKNGQGLSLLTTSTASGQSSWIENAAIQEVASFAGCYEWNFSHTHGYATTASGDPVAASGVQVIQAGRSIWFVPSDVAAERTTTLADGTRVVELPARSGESTTVAINLRRHAPQLGLDLEVGGFLKLFNAVHETIAMQSELETQDLDAGACTPLNAGEALRAASQTG